MKLLDGLSELELMHGLDLPLNMTTQLKSSKNQTEITLDKCCNTIIGIINTAKTQIARTVNREMVQAYWLIGREIVEVQQSGAQRADYGRTLLENFVRR